jgi:hypothetical protein
MMRNGTIKYGLKKAVGIPLKTNFETGLLDILAKPTTNLSETMMCAGRLRGFHVKSNLKAGRLKW